MSSLPFLTAYDPLGGVAGSIDPLGALRTYGSLVDLFLPGISTVTNRSRYLSMLCAAFSNTEKYGTFPNGPAGLVVRRRAVEPFERLWALACVAAKQNGITSATDKLRGVTYAEAALQEFQVRNKPATPDFRMLKYQHRTGGVATYWTTLVSGDLVLEEGLLVHEGHELAKEFPNAPDDIDLKHLVDPIASRRLSLSWESLLEWGKVCHLGAATKKEKQLLIEALRCSDRRDRVAASLEKWASERRFPQTWGVNHLQKLIKCLSNDDLSSRLLLPNVIEAIIHFENFHEAALTIFEMMLWWGTMFPERPISQLLSDKKFRENVDRARIQGNELRKFENEHVDVPIRRVLKDFSEFGMEIGGLSEPRRVLDEILRRHKRVQAGKIDGGTPKREWVTYGPGGKFIRPPLRHQRSEPPPYPEGKRLTHPYRIEEFVAMLSEIDGLPRTKEKGNGSARD